MVTISQIKRLPLANKQISHACNFTVYYSYIIRYLFTHENLLEAPRISYQKRLLKRVLILVIEALKVFSPGIFNSHLPRLTKSPLLKHYEQS